MRVTVKGFGILREHFPEKTQTIEMDDFSTIRTLLKKLKITAKKNFYDTIMINNNLAPHVTVLLNGLSIEMKQGLDTELADGDILAFTILIDGG